MESRNEIIAHFAQTRNVGIFTHRNPDGDALGSSMAFYHLLNQMGHSCQVFLPSEYPVNFEWIPDMGHTIIWDLEPEIARERLNLIDTAIFVDFNSIDRIDKLGECLQGKKLTIWTIDHHLDPMVSCDWLHSDSSAASTTQIIWNIILDLGWKKYCNTTIANCLMTGILTDTGNFSYSTTPNLLRISGDIIEAGAEYLFLQEAINNAVPEKQLRLLGHCLCNRMEIFPELHLGLIYLDKEDYRNFDIKRGDTEGFVNYLLKMNKVKVAAFIAEQPAITKISLRSKGDINVEEICKEHFKGGGHKNASGGGIYQPLSQVIKKLKEVLPLHLNKYSF